MSLKRNSARGACMNISNGKSKTLDYRGFRVEFMDVTQQQINLALEYTSLARISELSEPQIERMSQILDAAIFDDSLACLINEIDYLIANSQPNLPPTIDKNHEQESKILKYVREFDVINILGDEELLNFSKSSVNQRLISDKIIQEQIDCFYLPEHTTWTDDTSFDSDKTSLNGDNLTIYSPNEYKDSAKVMKSVEDIIAHILLKLGDDNSSYELILFEYWKLATSLELSDFEAELMDKILSSAESNPSLGILINELDYWILQEQNLLSPEKIHHYQNQEAKIREYLPLSSTKDKNKEEQPDDVRVYYSYQIDENHSFSSSYPSNYSKITREILEEELPDITEKRKDNYACFFPEKAKHHSQSAIYSSENQKEDYGEVFRIQLGDKKGVDREILRILLNKANTNAGEIESMLKLLPKLKCTIENSSKEAHVSIQEDKNNTPFTDTINNVSSRLHEERHRQTNATFNIAISLAATTAILSVVAATSVWMGNISAAAATTLGGLTSGFASTRLFKLSADANKRLDDLTKQLLGINKAIG